MSKVGKLVIPDGIAVWSHEIDSAKVLAHYGYTVEFIKAVNQKGQQTADCLIDGVAWEMKAPRASNIKAVERNLKRGKWQSSYIVFDSRRMKHIPDKVIERELRKRFSEIKEIKHIKFINRRKEIIEIY